MIAALQAHGVEGLGANSNLPAGLSLVAGDRQVPHRDSGVSRHALLTSLHALLRPRTYAEIGIDQGQSLTLSRTRSIAVDPGYRITCPLHCDVQTFRTTSDDFFADPDGFAHFGGVGVDLAFIDGMHLAEFALRDFMNMEKHMSPWGVIVLDDMMPRNALEADRVRKTSAWTGDVHKVHQVLSDYRPDLTLIPVNTEPTGSYVVVGLDPTSRVLDDAYEQIEAELITPDPQAVDDAWLRRTHAYDPVALVTSSAWERLRQLREQDAPAQNYREVWTALADSRRG